MPPKRPKPPNETKAELMKEVALELFRKYPRRPDHAVEFLLNFFTAADLVGIRDELKGSPRD